MKELSIGDDFEDADLGLCLVGSVEEGEFLGEARVGQVFTHGAECFVIVEIQVIREVDGGKGFDVLEDRIELDLEGFDFFIGKVEAGEFCDVFYIDMFV